MTTTSEVTHDEDEVPRGKPLLEAPPSFWMRVLVVVFVVVPFLALAAALPLAWVAGWGPDLLIVAMIVVMYTITCAGIGVGFHRYFTHGSFKANRGLRIALAVAGSLAGEGELIQWVADHRRHHKFSDMENDPHSPWRFGGGPWGLTKGLWHAHWGWLFTRELSNRERFAPDLLKDKDIARIDKLFPWFVTASLGLPALVAGLVTWSWQEALLALFWAGIVRFAVLHHVTWSINSICHVFGERPFKSQKGDKAANVWWLAIASFGESWHNLHHADPTCARHGVDKGQIDINAWFIRLFEKFGWATRVKWPKPERLAQRRLSQTV
ncbi:MAG TPA: acyl-CoA desaturase [Candidatus Saccharimonadales bacterium]|nr:acyl-CoA desaturase [Candidatus Saccharimonadales bacterium]